MPYNFGLVVAIAFAAFFFKAGKQEPSSGLWWGGLSVIVSAVVLMMFSGGMLAVFLAQLGLLAAITLFRVWRDPN